MCHTSQMCCLLKACFNSRPLLLHWHVCFCTAAFVICLHQKVKTSFSGTVYGQAVFFFLPQISVWERFLCKPQLFPTTTAKKSVRNFKASAINSMHGCFSEFLYGTALQGLRTMRNNNERENPVTVHCVGIMIM